MKNRREVLVAFVDGKLKELFGKLEKSSPELYKFVSRAIDDLKNNPFCGIHIPKRLIPRVYTQKYGIDNLWKYDMPKGWRLLYSAANSEVSIISIILEWMDHKDYERRFKY